MMELIGDEATLAACLQSVPAEAEILADCEFVRERTFWPKLALLQLNIGGQIVLIDAPQLGRSASLDALFARATPTVMHSPSEDLECFQHSYGWVPAQLFDTQLAAAYCGLGAGLSYRALVEQFTGTALDKGETRSDWLARPLSESQLRYAADDVIYLQPVYQALRQRLQTVGHVDWFEEDCAATLERARAAADAPLHVVLEPKATQRLDALATARLQCVMDWREQEARRADRPRSWIIDNETAYRLAQSKHGDLAAHRRCFESSQRVSKRAPEALWQAFEGIDSAALPTKTVAVEHDSRQYRHWLRELQDEVARCAETLGLPPGLLLPRRHLEHLLDSGEWPPAVTGWRRAQLADRLLAARGKLVVT